MADVTANTRAIILLPNVPDSQWWSKIKHAKIVSVIPANVRCMQRWTDVAWTGMLAPASGLSMVVFPRGAGEHIIPVKRLALYATDTKAVTVIQAREDRVPTGRRDLCASACLQAVREPRSWGRVVVLRRLYVRRRERIQAWI